MRRRVKTTPFQREILWSMADDAEGRISFLALLKHLTLKFPAEPPDKLLQKIERDIRVLERQVGLYFYWQLDAEEKSVLWTERTAMQFKDLFRWNETANQWEVQPKEPPFSDLIVQLTQGAVEVLELI